MIFKITKNEFTVGLFKKQAISRMYFRKNVNQTGTRIIDILKIQVHIKLIVPLNISRSISFFGDDK